MVKALDTAKDARILVLEDALGRLNEIIGTRKLRMHVKYSSLVEAIKIAGSLFYEVKYSYLDSHSLASLPATEKMVSAIDQFAALFRTAIDSSGYKPSSAKADHTLADVLYSLRIIQGFQERLRKYDEDPAHAVDILVVEITQTEPVEDSKNLIACRCTDGSRIWNIVTNLKNVKPGVKLTCAVLPPVEMMGIVSEAMFLSGEPLPPAIELGVIDELPENVLAQARTQVLQLTKRMT